MAITSAPHRGGHTAHRGQLAVIAAVTAAFILATLAVVLLVHGAGPSSPGIQGSGIAAAQTRTVAGFSRLELAGSNNVTVVVAAPQSVVVHADSNLISHVTTQVVGGTLVIGDTGSFTTRAPMSVEVSVPSLTMLNLSGDGQISVTGINVPRLTVTASQPASAKAIESTRMPGSTRRARTARRSNARISRSGRPCECMIVR